MRAVSLWIYASICALALAKARAKDGIKGQQIVHGIEDAAHGDFVAQAHHLLQR